MAIAIEDAAVIGALLSYILSIPQAPALLHAYKDLWFVHSLCPPATTYEAKKRQKHTTATQESSRKNQKIFHLPDRPDQRARDDAMRTMIAAELEGKPIPDGNPNQWADRTKSWIRFEYDAYGEVERWWMDGGREQMEVLGDTPVAMVRTILQVLGWR